MFNEFSNDILLVSETFVSIQGESTWAGCPCFFIRLAGCNLRCSYCDTKYALEGGAPWGIADLVGEYQKSGMRVAEVTGGEPLLQSGTAGLLKSLLSFGTVLLETNGSFDISAVPQGVVTVMDVKCPGSGESEAMDWRNISRLRPCDEVKFVISNRVDFDWALKVIADYRLSGKCRALLMSPVFEVLDPLDLADWMIQEKVPARLNLQIHRNIWPCSNRGR